MILYHGSYLTIEKPDLYIEIREGISDMHCRSDGYLAEELQREVSRMRDT